MRLLILSVPIFSSGGGIRHASAVARAATDAGWDVDLVVGVRSGVDSPEALIREIAPHARVLSYRVGPLSGVWKTVVSVLRFRAGRGDVVYAASPQSILVSYVVLSATGGIQKLVAGLQGSLIPREVAAWKQRIYRSCFRRIMADSRLRVAAVSRATLADSWLLLNVLPHPASWWLGNVSVSIGDAPWVEHEPVDLAVPERGRTVIVAGRLTPEKGVDLAIEALAYCRPETRLLVCGEGSARRSLEVLAATRGFGSRVDFLGWEDPLPHMSRAGVVVIPSRSEGFPLTLLEASWLGCPIVATRVGGIPEVAEALPNVRLVEPEDPLGLARAIEASLDMRSMVRRAVPAEHRWAEFSQRVEALIAR